MLFYDNNEIKSTCKDPRSKNTIPPRSQSSWGQHGAHLGPVGPRWAPCWPHEPCYQGYPHGTRGKWRGPLPYCTACHGLPLYQLRGRGGISVKILTQVMTSFSLEIEKFRNFMRFEIWGYFCHHVFRSILSAIAQTERPTVGLPVHQSVGNVYRTKQR